MSMTDPIADMLTRIRNAIARGYTSVTMPHAKTKQAVAAVMQKEGYIDGFSVSDDPVKKQLTIELSYFQGEPAIGMIKRISRPGLRNFVGKGELPRVKGGYGTAIVSTSKGMMTALEARRLGIGGEVICEISS